MGEEMRMKNISGSTFRKLCAFILAFMLMITNMTGLVEVKAAGVPAPTIDKVFYDATTISGAGVHRGKINKQTVRGTIHVILKNGDTVKHETSVTPKSGTKWNINLPKDVTVEPGDTVVAYQEFDGQNSPEVTANAEPSLAYNHKNDLKMPSGDFYLEQYVANIVNDDEKAEALQMLKDANPSFSDKIESVEFSIKGIEEDKRAYYIVNYTDKSKSEEIEAPNLKIVKVTEHSRKYTLEPYSVVSTVIKGKLNGDGPFSDIKVQFSSKLSEADKANFCEGGNCTIDKNSAKFQTIDVNPQTGEFSIDVGENTLELDKVIGIVVKEKHKFATCNSSTPEIAIPKVDVKDPKKLKPEEKEAIVDAIRKANTTPSGKSKLPDGTGDWVGVPAVIQVDDSGNVKIFSGNDVAGNWDPNNDYKFVPETNEDGSYKLKNEAKSKTTLDKPEELVSNLAPDAPKMENKGGNVVVTPNIEVDTDAKKVVVEYEGADGSKKTITATKTDTGWTVDDSNAKVDENGVVTIPTKEVKSETTVTAYVVDDGGLVPEETALDSTKAELKIENKYKVTYDPNGGEGTMPEEEVNVGSKYRIKDNGFKAPEGKEFDHWMIGIEPKNSGEDIEVNNDIVIKAIYKYIINPTASEVETTVGHPVSYKMYKDAIKDFPADLKVEHIEVKEAPDISKTGGTQATIEVRFSDGQFREIPVTVNVKPDPKDKEIEKLNKDIEDLNKQITDLNNTISEKDAKIEELNKKITELEKKLQECKNQCAIDKKKCAEEKEALNKQIQDLTVEKTRLETVVHDYDELIKELRAHQETLNKQITDLKETVKGKDAEIAKLLEKIGGLETKIETLTTENTDLKEKLATANQKITDLESKITDLEGQVKDLTEKLNAKETEIKTLNETITSLKEQIAKLETEKAKDKEVYDKDKANLEKQLQEAKDALTKKETELNKIKEELKTANNDLATEKAKTAGLEEQVKAKDERIADLEKQIEALNKKIEEAGNNNTTIIEKYETTIKEKETLIEKLTSEKAELEKQLATEKAKNENLEKQVADLNTKADKAAEDLNKANAKISDLEKELAVEKEKNKNLTEQLNKITTELENKTKEVETLNKTVTELKEQLAKITAEQAKDKEACEKAKAELQEKLDKANQDLTDKNNELDNIKKELEQAKKDLAAEQAKNAGLDADNKAKADKIADLEKRLSELQDKLNTAAEDLKKANDRILELEKQLTEKETENKALTEQVEKLGKDLETKTAEVKTLTDKVTELEKQVAEKTAKGEADAKEIERLKAELEKLKKQLDDKNTEVENLNKEIVTLKETVKTLEGEKTELTNNVTRLETEVKELKEKLDTANNKILELEKENAGLKAENKALSDKVSNLEKQVEDAKATEKELREKITELTNKITELEKATCDAEELKKLIAEKANLEGQLKGKDELIQELRNQITELKEKVKEIDTLKDKVKELEIKIVNLTNENNKLKEDLNAANTKIADLEKSLEDEKAKNEALEKDKANLEKDKADLENDKADLQDALKKSEEDKAKLKEEKKELEDQVAKLKEELNNCPADATDEINKLKAEIEEKEKLIEEKDKSIAEKDKLIKELQGNLDASDKMIKQLEERIKYLESRPREKEYVYVRERDTSPRYDSRDYDRLRSENESLRKENRELRDKIKELEKATKCDPMSYKEKYVTVFSLDSILYKTFLDEELMTQAEMTDFKGYIKPFISNSRTMLPMRYIALSLGLDVNWDNATRTATFTNSGKYNVLNPTQVSVSADTLEMKDQFGNVINVDSKPILKEGRFYISITNLIKALGGTNGNIEDGVKNTIEWDQFSRRVLVYKYAK